MHREAVSGPTGLESRLSELVAAAQGSPEPAPALVEGLLNETYALGASDLHLLPQRDGLHTLWRVDGVLHGAGVIAGPLAAAVVGRLKVLCELLTYETSRPQEGRLRDAPPGRQVRVSTFPTIHGEKVVARVLPLGDSGFDSIAALALPAEAAGVLSAALDQTSGAIVIVGPAGSGKTTTAYACLREVIRRTAGRRSVVTLEDPVEGEVAGAAQSQAAPHAGFDMPTALRSLLRQDPEVILVGEIRDPETARLAYQAAMTGQLVVTTFHASSVAEAVVRLLDMGTPPFVVRGATRAIVAQRLVRTQCACAEGGPRADCPQCHGVGLRGRAAIAEGLSVQQPAAATAIRESTDRTAVEAAAAAAGMTTLLESAEALLNAGAIDHAELVRVLGIEPPRG
ncbi:Type II secretion system protein E [Pirellulimonas nuda]|uniref:Type II secretion system protein E n=1 Tax=Pirellulimonas nuda TaxID=2528009 RepID=A0A518DI02_9BACT|nr:ATPase, T2SS/T4P/T4SS family [Pirellulimonas nuda]QDU91108.1 Type II secretion system protein E [Pirellulimonas nuda]